VRPPPSLSVDAAASTIPTDPRNLARHIRQLERELGQQLVHRAAPPNPITGVTDHRHALANIIAIALEQTPNLASTEITRRPCGRPRR
jgi:DNA-binding transcriptional LysR family regulator